MLFVNSKMGPASLKITLYCPRRLEDIPQIRRFPHHSGLSSCFQEQRFNTCLMPLTVTPKQVQKYVPEMKFSSDISSPKPSNLER